LGAPSVGLPLFLFLSLLSWRGWLLFLWLFMYGTGAVLCFRSGLSLCQAGSSHRRRGPPRLRTFVGLWC
jgi:hypothetical protein